MALSQGKYLKEPIRPVIETRILNNGKFAKKRTTKKLKDFDKAEGPS
jgi:hypothetical protein